MMMFSAYCPSHSDNEPTLSPTDDIFTLSVSASRKMRFDNVNSGVGEAMLHDNSLLVFSRHRQCQWKHSIPVDTSVSGVRYSVTVRNIRPYNVNCTYVYGDSNTTFIKFGTGPKTLGRWCPGKQIRAARVRDLPTPADIPPVRNMIIHTGLNDLRDAYTPLTPSQIVQQMENKCAAIHKVHPQMRIFLSPLLPSRNEQLNRHIRETNAYIEMLSRKHNNLFMTNNNDFANKEGLLMESIASRKVNDTVHLNLSGIIKLGLLFRSYAVSRDGYVHFRDFSGVDMLNIQGDKEAQTAASTAGGNSSRTEPADTPNTVVEEGCG